MAKKNSSRRGSRTKKKRVTATRGGTGRSRRKTSRKSSSRSKKRAELKLNVKQKALIVGIILIFLTAVLVLSILSPNQAILTAYLQRLLFSLFGWAGYAVPLALAGGGFYLVLWGMDQPPQLPLLRLVGLVMLFLVFEAFATIIALSSAAAGTTVWGIAAAGSGGGYIGGLLAFAAIELVDTFGAVFLYLVLGIIGAVLVSGISRADMGTLVASVVEAVKERRAAVAAADSGPRTAAVPPGGSGRAGSSQPELPLREGNGVATPAQAARPAAKAAAEKVEEEEKPASSSRRSRRRRKKEETTPESQPETAPAPVILGQGGNAPAPEWKLPAVAEMLEKGSEGVVSDDSIREQTAVIEHTLESFGAPARVVDVNQGPTVTQYGVEPLFLESRSGKRTKVKVGKIASLADDLALALAAHSVRIQAPVPGKGYVGIEVPNVDNVLVSLRDVMEAREFTRLKSDLRIGLGQNVAGKPIATDLAKMPHLLIAGTTGSGKSVCVNSIIACLLLNNTPDDLKFVMVDPKRVELTGYNGIPHLAAPVVVEMDRVVGVLQWAMREMDNRYKRFAEAGTRNIDEYNKLMTRRGEIKLPYVVIVIDELADLMMMSPEETERGVSRLAQMARATGIHMIIATQRPSVDVVTGLIKANFPARIAFAVSSGTDSRVILDQTGAERLLGRGDMLFQSPDAAAPLRLQGCFVSDRELNGIIDYWKTARRYNLITTADAQPRSALATVQARAEEIAKEAAEQAGEAAMEKATAPKSEKPAAPQRESKPQEETSPPAEPPSVPANVDANGNGASVTKADVIGELQQKKQPLWEDLIEQEKEQQQWEDELMPEVIELVRDLGKASTSLLQRRFRIGYTRAARLIDAMEDASIIGPPTGTSKAREVYDEEGNVIDRKRRRKSGGSDDDEDEDEE